MVAVRHHLTGTAIGNAPCDKIVPKHENKEQDQDRKFDDPEDRNRPNLSSLSTDASFHSLPFLMDQRLSVPTKL